MPENWPVRSDYNSKWVFWAWAEPKSVCVWLENINETLFTGAVSKLQKKFIHGEDVHHHLVCPKD